MDGRWKNYAAPVVNDPVTWLIGWLVTERKTDLD